MNYQLSAPNGIPTFRIENIDIVKAIGIDWNWNTLSKITDSNVRHFFEELKQALCSIETPEEEKIDCGDECEQDILARTDMLRIEMSILPTSIDWDESLWLYIYGHIDLWQNYIHDGILLNRELLYILQVENGIEKIITIIRNSPGVAVAEAELMAGFDIHADTAKAILNMGFSELTSLSESRCSALLAYWTEIERVFTSMNK